MAKATIVFDAKMNIGQLESALSKVKGDLNKLTLPKNMTSQFEKSFLKLDTLLQTLKSYSGVELAPKDSQKLLKTNSEVIQQVRLLDSLMRDLSMQSTLKPESFGLKEMADNMSKVLDSFAKYNKAVKETQKSNEFKNLSHEYSDYQKKLEDAIKDKKKAEDKLHNLQVEKTSRSAEINAAQQRVDAYYKEQKAISELVLKKDSLKNKEIPAAKASVTEAKNALANSEKQLKALKSREEIEKKMSTARNFSKATTLGKRDVDTKSIQELEIAYNKMESTKSTSKSWPQQVAALKEYIAARKELAKIDEVKSDVDFFKNNLQEKQKYVESLNQQEENFRKELADRREKQNEKSIGKDIDLATVNEGSKLDSSISAAENNIKKADALIAEFTPKVEQARASLTNFLNTKTNSAWESLGASLKEIGIEISNFSRDEEGVKEIFSEIENVNTASLEKAKQVISGLNDELEETKENTDGLKKQGEAYEDAFRQQTQFDQEVDSMRSRIQYFFGLNNAINLFQRGVRQAYETVKELDNAMTETAVVTDFSVSDMWDQLPRYTKAANDLGATTLGAYETMTLFYQQGLDTDQAFALGTETMKMARIANLDYANATNLMTAALRGFNMELNEVSAKKVNDVYSELAAITAADTQEIASAMTKTASIANSANMDFETTAAFLSQIIETTRESAETAGTAMKTIVARFTEVKKLGQSGGLIGKDTEGEVININKIDAALKTIGMSLSGFISGEQGLDDILLELASKWDNLDIATQRYIATTAAGSRQQSRFLAMMSDYDRTLELVNAAQNSTGAGEEQFAKTQDSLKSKLNALSNAWNEFTMGLANNKLIKFGVDALTKILNIVNKLTGAFGSLGGLLKVGVGASLLRGGGTLAQTAVNWLAGSFTGASKSGGAMAATLQQAGKSVDGGNVSKAYGSFLRDQFLGPYMLAKNGAKGLKEKIFAGFGSFKDNNKAYSAEGDEIWVPVKTAEEEYDFAEVAYREAKSSREAYHKSKPRNRAHGKQQRKIKPEYTKKDVGALGGIRDTKRDIFNTSKEIANKKYGTFLSSKGNWLTQKGQKAATKGLGKLFLKKEIGTKLGAAIGLTGKAGASAAAGLAALGTSLSVFTVAAIAAVPAIKAAWKAFTPEGQLKTAKEHAEIIKQVSQSNAEQLKKAKSNQAKYDELTEKVDSEIGLKREKAINELNQHVYSMIDQDANLAKFVIEKNGKISLEGTDSSGATYEDYINNQENAVKNNNLGKLLSQAIVNQKEGERLTGAWNTGVTNFFKSRTANDPEAERERLNKIDAEKAKGYKIAAEEGMANFARNALQDSDFSAKTNELIAQAYGSVVDADDIQKKINDEADYGFFNDFGDWITGKDSLKSLQTEYNNLTGMTADSSWGKKELADAIANFKAVEAQEGQIDKISDLVKLDKSGGIEATLQAIAGDLDADFSKANSLLDNQSIELSDLQEAFNFEGSFEDFLAQQREAIKEQQNRLMTEIGTSLLNVGYNGQDVNNFLRTNTFAQMQKVQDFLSSDTNYSKGFQNKLINPLVNGNQDYQQSPEMQEYIDNLLKNAENPIALLAQLKKGFNSTNKSIATYTKGLVSSGKEVNKTSANWEDFYGIISEQEEAFSKKSLLSSVITSEGYSKVSEEIGNIIKETGDLDAGNIERMAEESEVLSDALESGAFTSYELANALTAVEKGGVAFSSLSDQVLEAMGSVQSFSDLASSVLYDIESFKPGEDWGKAFDFITDGLETIEELVNARELGNPLLHSYFSKFLGGPTPEDLAGWEQGIETLKTATSNGGQGFWTDIVGFQVDDNGVIQDMQLGDKTLAEYHDYVKNLASSRDFNFTDDFIDEMIVQAGNHDYGMLEQLGQNTIKQMISNYISGFKGTADEANTITQEDVIALAAALNTSKEDIMNQINQQLANSPLTQDNGDPIHLTFEALPEFKVSDASIEATQVVHDVIQNAIKNHSGDGPVVVQLGDIEASLSENGINLPEEQINSIINEQLANTKVEGKEPIQVGAKALVTTQVGDLETGILIDSHEVDVTSTNVNDLKQGLTAVSETTSINVDSSSVDGAQAAVSSLETSLTNLTTQTYTVNVGVNYSGLGFGMFGISPGSAAGGFVSSYGNGSGKNKVKPGPALTGEEDPEIIWNKEKGYAYMAGANGPEYNVLNPGDRVFNASETKKILANSRKNSRPSLASGGYTPSYGGGTIWGTGGGSSGDGGSRSQGKKEDEWKNDLDWLYNLMEDIAELERDQEKYNKIYEDLLTDSNATGHSLVELTRDQISNLYEQQRHQEDAYGKRLFEMQEYLDVNKQFAGYGTYNFEDQTIEIDWERIDQITDKDQYEDVEDYIKGLEKIQDRIDTADDALFEINEQIRELEEKFTKTYTEFQDRVLDALVDSYQKQIDNQSNINNTIKDTTSSLFNSIQKALDQQRQDRENSETEKDLGEKERRLAFLRQDTSKNNLIEIKELEEELADARQDYTDELIDQKLTQLQDQEDFAAEQREREIELMQAQLEYAKISGELWEEVYDIIDTAIDPEGKLINDSKLVDLLKNKENWQGLSAVQGKVWGDELEKTFKEVVAYKEMGTSVGTEDAGKTVNFLDKEGNSLSGTVGKDGKVHVKDGNGKEWMYSGIKWDREKEAWTTSKDKEEYIPPPPPPKPAPQPSYSQPQDSGYDGNQYWGGDSKIKQWQQEYNKLYPSDRISVDGHLGPETRAAYEKSQKTETYLKPYANSKGHIGGRYNQISSFNKKQIFATGGLADYTGPAWLDGTSSRPELVLNQQETQNFLKLKDVLSDFMKQSSSSNFSSSGDNYYDIHIDATIGSDYDVEKLTTKIKKEIVKDADYRNANVIRRRR